MREDHDVTRPKSDRPAIFELRERRTFDEQVENDQVFRARQQGGSHRIGARRGNTPGRRELRVEEQGSLQFHRVQDFRKCIHNGGLSAKNSGRPANLMLPA
jgi:hypothetical protein